ncbi:MAG: c-type cytochrome [Flavobacteriaceae bacterium]
MNTRRNIAVLTVLIITFCCYNYFIYTSNESKTPVKLSNTALRGQELWQKNNCWSCHQTYGLGGYLGPDLTNIYSNKHKGPEYIKAFLNSGVKSMPKFNFSEDEKNAIVEYLKAIDSTGTYPNYNAEIDASGWVKLQYKHEK